LTSILPLKFVPAEAVALVTSAGGIDGVTLVFPLSWTEVAG
jgi:hypothetical protein